MYVENNRVRLCCESEERIEKYITTENTVEDIWYSDFYRNTRQQMLDGVLPDSCRICKLMEETGDQSKRQWDNFVYNKFIGDVNDFISLDVPLPINFDVRPSNKCNLECVMCNGIVSTSISQRVKEYKKEAGLDNFVIQEGKDWKDHNHIIQYVKENSDKIRILKLDGGEPFLLPEVLDVIDYLVETGDSKHIRISFISNGTVVRSKWFSEKLIHFENVKLTISLDAVGDVLNYVRYPSKWSAVDSNLRLFKQMSDEYKNFKVSLDPVIHLLNALHLHEVFEYADSIGLHANLSPVYQTNNQTYLHTSLLTDELRQEAYKRITNTIANSNLDFNTGSEFVNDLLKQKYNPDPVQIAHLNSIIKYWDSHRPVKFIDQYPYLKYLLTDK